MVTEAKEAQLAIIATKRDILQENALHPPTNGIIELVRKADALYATRKVTKRLIVRTEENVVAEGREVLEGEADQAVNIAVLEAQHPGKEEVEIAEATAKDLEPRVEVVKVTNTSVAQKEQLDQRVQTMQKPKPASFRTQQRTPSNRKPVEIQPKMDN